MPSVQLLAQHEAISALSKAKTLEEAKKIKDLYMASFSKSIESIRDVVLGPIDKCTALNIKEIFNKTFDAVISNNSIIYSCNRNIA